MQLFDSHCHLDSKEYAADPDAVLARARAAGVEFLVNIQSVFGGDGAAQTAAFAKNRENVWAAIGIHPHDAAKANEEILAAMIAAAKGGGRKVVAWGEIGLDYWYQHAPRETQDAVFRRQIEIALDLDLPISLHVRDPKEGGRDASRDLLVILRDEKVQAGDALRGVWHCFTGDPEHALEAAELGFVISIPGIVTFPKGDNVREATKQLPLSSLVIETDSPYLAPAPYRGKSNEPAYLVETARAVAALKGVTLEELARVTTENARRLYELDRDRD